MTTQPEPVWQSWPDTHDRTTAYRHGEQWPRHRYRARKRRQRNADRKRETP